MKNISDIISNMPSNVRAKAEKYAESQGTSLEQAVAQQLGTELSDADLQMVSGGAEAIEVEIEIEI